MFRQCMYASARSQDLKAQMTERCVVRKNTVMKQMMQARMAVRVVGHVRKKCDEKIRREDDVDNEPMKERAKMRRTSVNSGARRWW